MNFFFSAFTFFLLSSVAMSSVAQSKIRCGAFFSKRPYDRVRALSWKLGRTFSASKMEEIMTSVAQGELEFPIFSPWVHRALQERLALEVRGDQVRRLASLPYDNALARLRGRKTMTPRDIFGRDISLQDFGIQQELSPHPDSFGPKDIARLSLIADAEGEGYKREYLRREGGPEGLSSLQFNISMSKLQRLLPSVRSHDYRQYYGLKSRTDHLNRESIFWTFLTLAREKQVRSEIERFSNEGDSLWHDYPQRYVDQYIILISAFPELLALTNVFPRLGFDPYVNFNDLTDSYISNFPSRLVADDSLLASLSLVKTIRGDGHLIEGTDYPKIDVIYRNPTNSDINPIPPESMQTVPRTLQKHWLMFARKRNLDPSKMTIEVDDSWVHWRPEGPETFALRFELGQKGSPSFLDIATFYLEITHPQKRDFQDRLVQFF